MRVFCTGGTGFLGAHTALVLPSEGHELRLLVRDGHEADCVKRLVPLQTQVSAESMAINTRWPYADSTRFLTKSGMSFRSGDETLSDTIRWLTEAGHIPVKKAGRLAPLSLTPQSERNDVP